MSLMTIQTGSCHCNLGIEDTSHFLFSCLAYANQRATLITSVNVILQEYNFYVLRNQLKLYLYGHRSINCSDNKKNYFVNHRYIEGTGRYPSYS